MEQKGMERDWMDETLDGMKLQIGWNMLSIEWTIKWDGHTDVARSLIYDMFTLFKDPD